MTEAPEPTPAEIVALNERLIDELRRKQLLGDARVEAAFRAVQRHHFLPQVPLAEVYSDAAIPTKFGAGVPISSSSQPAIMAIMLEQLALAPGLRVLEVGAGTGYNAALLAQLVGPTGQVTAIDIDQDTVDTARAQLARAGFGRVAVVCGDGAQGFPAGAPFDRIIITAATWELLPAWLEQLAPGGRLVAPLMLLPGVMVAAAFEWMADGWQSVAVSPCGFMPLRGPSAPPQVGDPSIRIDPKPASEQLAGFTATIEKAGSRTTVAWPRTSPPAQE